MKRWIVPQLALVVTVSACDRASPPPPAAEPWPDDAEVTFQQAEVLRYELIRRQTEAARLRAQGLDGVPPMPRPTRKPEEL